MAQLPSGDGPLPPTGVLPEIAASESEDREFSVYVHVPFCRVRCGYCDFNTYTAPELRGASQSEFHETASAELDFASRALRASNVADREVSTLFFGGGTPTLLEPSQLTHLISRVADVFGLGQNAEVTVEANPDSVDAHSLDTLREGGVTRLSLGMQSAVPRVLEVLDRTHHPENVDRVAAHCRDLELPFSVDLIYGAPTETFDDWRRTVDAALETGAEHISAYSLIVEDGTALARQIRSGELPPPDPDLQAEMYSYIDDAISQEGFAWYEVSNWAKSPDQHSRHNLNYWLGNDWWGVGPGAHSHVGGVRWWNVKHPAAYLERISANVSPAQEHEVVDAQQQQLERVMLHARLASGLSTELLSAQARMNVAELIADELVDAQAAFAGRLVLTQRGRLLADRVIHLLTD